jgi:stringent starvation protein B
MRAPRASGRQEAVAKLSSRRPYLLRAMREWMLDNALTPHIIVDASAKDVVVPAGSVRGGRIVLNISDSAVTALRLGNEAVEFCARFGGRAFDVHVPVEALIGIYARESGHGLLFAESDEPTPSDSPGPDNSGGSKPRRPTLKVIK